MQTFKLRLDEVWENQPVFLLQGSAPTLIIKIWTQRTQLFYVQYHK